MRRIFNIRKSLLFTFIFILTLSAVFLIDCGRPGVYVNRKTGKVWYVDDSGGVQTNDLTRLQRETPFIIIIPSYLPVEVSSSPVMYIKTIGMNSKNDVDVQFAYWNSPKCVTIKEVNYVIKWGLNPGDSYTQINGIKVLQMPSKNYSDGVIVDMWDFGEEESRKVVESMIK